MNCLLWFACGLGLLAGQADDGGPVPPAAAAAIAPEAAVQVQTLLADRPELLGLMHPGDDVWTWLAVHFSNRGWTIRWSNDQARLAHYLARHTYTADGHPVVFVRRTLKSGAPVAPAAQLSGLVFELLNAEHEDGFRSLAARGERGEISRPAFILANARIEFEVCRATQEFYRAVWLPHARRDRLTAGGGNWHLGIGDDFAAWIAHHRQVSRDGYPDDVYGPEYDALTARHRAAEKAPAASSSGTQRSP